MADAKLKAALPKDEEVNGLSGREWSKRLLDEPEKQRVAIITFSTVEEKKVIAAGSVTPIVQISRIEPVADEAEAEALVNKLLDLAAERTGAQQLPIQDADDARVTALKRSKSALDFDDPDAA